ncbi:MAG: hypothetical protein ACFFEY_13265 [Candidatus Thorarchaeota archaeon]
MQFFSVTENGALRSANKIDFNENKVFLIDDIKKIYLWFGLKASKRKKDFSLSRAEKLKIQRKKTPKIEIVNQNQEYGSFLAIMDVLKKGLNQNDSIERRPELKIKYKKTIELIEAGIDPDFEAEITLDSHKLSQKNYTYEDLCRKLAELQLIFIKGKKVTSENDIKKKSEEIYKSSSTYEELCWLISELSKLIEKKT